jgi:hypothetical protein
LEEEIKKQKKGKSLKVLLEKAGRQAIKKLQATHRL